MPLYPFTSKTGQTIERYYPMADAPDLGTVITVDGVRYTRVLASGVTFDEAKLKIERTGYNREDRSLPKGDLGHGVGPHGNPIIASKSHEREVCARWGLRRD